MPDTTDPTRRRPGRRPDSLRSDPVDSWLLAPDPPETDGRKLRGARTRQALAEALITLIETGRDFPTAQEVAQKAGVSTRLIFHHFDDVEGVFAAATALQIERHWTRLRNLDPLDPLDQRIDAMCNQRRILFDAIGPVRRTALARSTLSSAIRESIAFSRQWLRGNLADSFATELEHAGSGASLLLDSIDVVASWESWEALRDTGHSSFDAENIVRNILRSLLA